MATGFLSEYARAARKERLPLLGPPAPDQASRASGTCVRPGGSLPFNENLIVMIIAELPCGSGLLGDRRRMKYTF